MEFIWSTETGFGSYPNHKRSRPLSSTVLDSHSTISAGARNGSVHVGWDIRCTRVWPSNIEHSAQENANLKHRISIGARHYSGPKTIALFGADTSGTIALHTFFPQTGGCSEGLGAFRFFFKKTRNLQENMSLNGEHLHILRVSHLFLWADLHFCHSCHKCYSP